MQNTIINIKEKLEEYEYKLTTKFKEAIYIFPNGDMIDGGFDCGMRGEDHRMIECLMNDMNRYDSGFWDAVHDRYGVVRLVPETKYALIKVGQELTPEQSKAIRVNRYKLEEY